MSVRMLIYVKLHYKYDYDIRQFFKMLQFMPIVYMSRVHLIYPRNSTIFGKEEKEIKSTATISKKRKRKRDKKQTLKIFKYAKCKSLWWINKYSVLSLAIFHFLNAIKTWQ